MLLGFGLHQANQAGVSPDLLLKQPALAAASIGVMAHPGFEFVSLDKYRGTLTLRQNETGQTYTLPPDQVLRGKVMDSGRTIGKLVRQDADSRLLDWVPIYPGSTSRGVIRQDAAGLRKGVATFEATAPVGRIAEYYNQALLVRGFEANRTSDNDTTTLNARSGDGGREVEIAVSFRGLNSSIRITFADRR